MQLLRAPDRRRASSRPASSSARPQAILVGDLQRPDIARWRRLVGARPGGGAPAGEGDAAQALLPGRAPGHPRPARRAPARRRPLRVGEQGAPDPQLVTAGHPARGQRSSAAALLSYDVPHHAPWDWRVSLYTWTKGIAAGAFLLAALLALTGLLDWSDGVTRWVAPLVGAGLPRHHRGAADLGSRAPVALLPDLHQPQWRAGWSRARSSSAATAAIARAALWRRRCSTSASAQQVARRARDRRSALATACYTAYLFAQAKARDLWQSPLLPPHLPCRRCSPARRRCCRSPCGSHRPTVCARSRWCSRSPRPSTSSSCWRRRPCRTPPPTRASPPTR